MCARSPNRLMEARARERGEFLLTRLLQDVSITSERIDGSPCTGVRRGQLDSPSRMPIEFCEENAMKKAAKTIKKTTKKSTKKKAAKKASK